jgi:hypothetical protein
VADVSLKVVSSNFECYYLHFLAVFTLGLCPHYEEGPALDALDRNKTLGAKLY